MNEEKVASQTGARAEDDAGRPAEKLLMVKVHFFYTIAILLLVIIFLITDRWTALMNFTEYLTNAATLTSLVLGLVAIFYSFVSNNGMSQTLGSIASISDGIKESKDKMGSFVEQTSEMIASEKKNSSHLAEISKSVEEHVSKLQSTLKVVSEKTELLHGTIASLPERMGQLENRFLEATNEMRANSVNASQPASTAAESLSTGQVRRFISTSSINGNFLSYACSLIVGKSIELSCDEFASSIGSTSGQYIYGYLVSMIAMGLLKVKAVENKDRTYIIKSMNEDLKNNVKSDLQKILEDKQKAGAEDVNRWQDVVKEITARYN